MLAEVYVILGSVIIACPVPFPVVVVAYAAIGFGQVSNMKALETWVVR